jgi:UDP-N-acetylglucosamine transferase subunit ALG13
MNREFVLPYHAAVRRALAQVASIVSRLRPTCILADDATPFFRKDLDLMSEKLAVPVMFHDSTLHHNTWSHKSCFFHDLGSFLRDAAEKTKNEALLLFKPKQPVTSLSQLDSDHCSCVFRFPPVRRRVTFVTSGTRFLEKCLLSDYLLHSDVERLVLPTLPPLEGQLEAELVSWLGTAQRSVVYISLGTIIRNGEILADLVRGVLRCGERVLVQGDAPELSGFDRNEVRQEVWLPQATAIAHPAVSLVITHGGSGSVEEALWNGKPLLCVPHAWDQYYNAWIASKLGVAVCVSKTRRASRPGFHLAVAKASGEPFRDNAQSIARIMHRCWQENEDAVADLFRTPAVGS